MALSTGFKDTVLAASEHPKFKLYDDLLRAEAADYNTRFAQTPGFVKLDWRVLKCMLLVESGPANKAWGSKPMQIGVPGDPGYGVLKDKAEGSDVVMSETLQKALGSTPIDDPEHNIRCGFAYLLTRLCKTEFQSVADETGEPKQHSIAKGETLAGLAKTLHTTPQEITKRTRLKGNPNFNPDRVSIGDKVYYYPAKIQRVIIGWLPMTWENIQNRYNSADRSKGDPDYAAKLQFVWDKVMKYFDVAWMGGNGVSPAGAGRAYA